MTGTISNILRIGKDFIVTIVSSSCEFEGETLVEVKKKTNKRSLSANSYFHVLSGKIADAMGVSKAYSKNFLLARYGQREIDEDGNPIVLAVRDGIDMMEREDIHTALVGSQEVYVEDQGYVEYSLYEVVRGSHTYDTKEMSVLIEGTITEAKMIGGIETMTPEEIARLEGIAEKHNHK